MSESLEKTKDAISVWNDLKNVREQFAPTATDKEFSFLVTLGRSLGANPFKREIWLVKYDKNSPASIFLGRDFYRKKAEEQPDYNGHYPDSVYEKDKYKVINGVPQHEYSLMDRGRLLGAYCIAWKKGIDHPFYVFVRIEEYNKNFANWKSMPDTMIKKVAEAQCLRATWQGVFAGTYDESEQWTAAPVNEKANVIPPPMIQKKEEPTFETTAAPVKETECEQEQKKSEQPDYDENSVDGLRDKIRNEAATHFPNPPSFSLWLKTLTSKDGYRGIETIDQSKSLPQLRFILGSLKRKIEDKKKAEAEE